MNRVAEIKSCKGEEITVSYNNIILVKLCISEGRSMKKDKIIGYLQRKYDLTEDEINDEIDCLKDIGAVYGKWVKTEQNEGEEDTYERFINLSHTHRTFAHNLKDYLERVTEKNISNIL